MKNKLAFFLILLLLLLLSVNFALAGGQENPRAPYLEDIEALSVYTPRSSISATITMDKAPSLTTHGNFTVTLTGSDTSGMLVAFAIQDRREEGGYMYYGSPQSSYTFETPDFYFSGDYTLWVFVYAPDDTEGENRLAYKWYYFTIKPDSTHPSFEETVANLASSCKGATSWHTLLNIHDWLTHNAYYDLNYEFYGVDIILRGKGVCDSYSKAFYYLCNAADIPCQRIVGSAHAWNVVQLDDKWYAVDVTWDDPTSYDLEINNQPVSGSECYDYFCLSKELMDQDHGKYNGPYSVSCTSLDANYDIHEGTWVRFGVRINSNYSGVYNRMEDIQTWLEQSEKNSDSGKYLYDMGTWDTYSYINTKEGGIWTRGIEVYRDLSIYAYGISKSSWSIPNGGHVQVNAWYSPESESVIVEFLGWNLDKRMLNLPAGLIEIGDSAFEGTNATWVYLPNGVERIGARAFANSAVRTIYVPSTIQSIDSTAFDGCDRVILVSGFTAFLRQYATEHSFMHLEDTSR